MKYLKIFPQVEMVDAEKTFNEFLREIDDKGHRVLHCQHKIFGTWMAAIYTVTDQKKV